jgi:hypothetical protein
MFNSASASLLFKNETHTGPVRGLDFNPITKNLLASGSINAEVSIMTEYADQQLTLQFRRSKYMT